MDRPLFLSSQFIFFEDLRHSEQIRYFSRPCAKVVGKLLDSENETADRKRLHQIPSYVSLTWPFYPQIPSQT